jgi:WD40 repeat protein
VSASNDRILTIWDASSGTYLQTLRGHSGSINSVAFSRDSTQLISASHDRTVKIWDARDGAYLQTLDDGHNDIVSAVAFSHDSTRFASASYDRTVKIWDTSNGVCLQTLNIGHNDTVDRLAFSDRSRKLILASGTSRFETWDQQTDSTGRTFWDPRTVSRVIREGWFRGSQTASRFRHLQTESMGYMDHRSSHETTNEPQFDGVALSSSGEWITYNSKNLIWLPPEYRPSCSAVSAGMVGIGVGSGEVWLFNVEAKDILSKVFSFS